MVSQPTDSTGDALLNEPRIQRSGFMLLKDEACFNTQLFRYRQKLVKERAVGELYNGIVI